VNSVTKRASIIFILALPLFLITVSVTWAINDMRLYRYGFDKYDISYVSGLTNDELNQIARDIRTYFNSGREPLDVRVERFGVELRVFKPHEVIHMRDVKRLIWGVYLAAAITGTLLLVIAAVGLLRNGSRFVPQLCRWTLWGGGLTVGLILAFGLASLVAFDKLFLLFHKISFANDFWMLDPTRDMLIILFPYGFWFDVTMFAAVVSIGMAIMLMSIAGVYLFVKRRRIKKPSCPDEPMVAGPSTQP